jgi:hypothetical protein
MPSTVASRGCADLLRDLVARVRHEHGQASARALVNGSQRPPDSDLAALGVADHFPVMVAAQDVNRHLLSSVEQLLTTVERERSRGWPPGQIRSPPAGRSPPSVR